MRSWRDRYRHPGGPLAARRGGPGRAYPNGVPLSGLSGSFISTADKAGLAIAGDLEIEVDVALTDWTPATSMTFVAQWRAVVGGRSYAFRVFTSGILQLLYSIDGAATLTASSTVAPTVSDGARLGVKVTLDVDNGSAGRDVKFWTSSDRVTWSQLGSTVTVGSTVTLHNSTEPLTVGARDAGTVETLGGRVFRAVVRSGINGTEVADFDSSRSGATGYTDLYGNVWAIN